MSTTRSDTAILIFIRSAHEEVRSKRFFPRAGYRKNLNMVRFLNRNVEAIANSSGLPTFVISGYQQEGAHFGGKLTNAIQSVFDEGFKKVIAIGNDCFQLSKQHILEAEQLLQSKCLVLGPEMDGGTYLIGLCQSAFDQKKFLNFPWQKAHLLSSIVDYANRLDLKFYLLKREEDIDSAKEFKRALDQLSYCSLKEQLLSILGLLIHYNPSFLFISLFTVFTFRDLQRGPPELSY